MPRLILHAWTRLAGWVSCTDSVKGRRASSTGSSPLDPLPSTNNVLRAGILLNAVAWVQLLVYVCLPLFEPCLSLF